MTVPIYVPILLIVLFILILRKMSKSPNLRDLSYDMLLVAFSTLLGVYFGGEYETFSRNRAEKKDVINRLEASKLELQQLQFSLESGMERVRQLPPISQNANSITALFDPTLSLFSVKAAASDPRTLNHTSQAFRYFIHTNVTRLSTSILNMNQLRERGQIIANFQLVHEISQETSELIDTELLFLRGELSEVQADSLIISRYTE